MDLFVVVDDWAGFAAAGALFGATDVEAGGADGEASVFTDC